MEIALQMELFNKEILWFRSSNICFMVSFFGFISLSNKLLFIGVIYSNSIVFVETSQN